MPVPSTKAPLKQASPLFIATLSACAALLGSAVGVYGSMVTTHEQVAAQRYLDRRQDLRQACVEVQARAYSVEILFQNGISSAMTQQATGKQERFDLFSRLETEGNLLSQEFGALSMDAGSTTIEAGKAIMKDYFEMLGLAGRRRTALAIADQIDGDVKKQARDMLQIYLESSPVRNKLPGQIEALARACRKDVESTQ